jgi:Bacterial protein of unknown function (DUF885)
VTLLSLILRCGLGAVVILASYPASCISETSRSEAHTDRDLLAFAEDFWAWRANYQPFSADDIPRIERTEVHRDWSLISINRQRTALADFDRRLTKIKDPSASRALQIDFRLMESALARVHWELDINRRWERDPTFYLDQTLTALFEALVAERPFDQARIQLMLSRIEEVPAILDQGRNNLHPVRAFAELAIDALHGIREKLQRVEDGVSPLLTCEGCASPETTRRFHAATEVAIAALEGYRNWLRKSLGRMPHNSATGRESYEFFLRKVALLPYSPQQLLELAHQEWGRAVAFEQFETQRNIGAPELKIARDIYEQMSTSQDAELLIRKFLQDKGILTLPPDTPHYAIALMPDYLDALSSFGETDDFGGPSRPHERGIRWVSPPSPQLGYFWLATAKDPRPDMVHEGVPGHFFQLWLSRHHEDPIRREYYDSSANEGLGFYSEEMMLQGGLFDDKPRTREIIYNFMRLRALRVEVDVKLALGALTIAQAADYLALQVPMDRKTAVEEAARFATTPGQAISYQVGKMQILDFLADARLKQGVAFNLRKFHDYLWKNGNVPIALQRWEYLDDDREITAVDDAHGQLR